LIYLHGNAEDLGYSKEMLLDVCKKLRVNVVAIEFPSYGAYKCKKNEANSEQIKYDSKKVYQYLHNNLQIEEKYLIVSGRSIGSGPACYLAKIFNPAFLILISAFTSVRNASKNIIGFLSIFLQERFNNLLKIQKAKCPCIFIHGIKDDVVPAWHSELLFKNCARKAKLYLSSKMTHNTLHFKRDIIIPIQSFM
jgi:hypothetical protein